MARKTRSVKGRVYYFKRPYILHMKEDKPTVYKIQICRGRVVKEADFIAYAAGAAHVPETTMITAKHAIFEAINYFVLNGHAVQLEGLGSFSPRIQNNHDLFSGVVIVVWYDGVNITISHLPMH